MGSSAEQTTCPEWAKYVPPEHLQGPVDYSSTPPGTGRGHRLRDLAVGEEAWAMCYGVFRDDRGALWINGELSNGHTPDTDGVVHVQRTTDGMRVLSWSKKKRIKEETPNRSGRSDIWVVEFPAQPTEASCLICTRSRPLADMRYDPGETENGIEDAWTCVDDPDCIPCIPWIAYTDLGRSWMRGRA